MASKKTKKATSIPSSETTLAALSSAYLDSIRSRATPLTVASYDNDLKVAQRVLGADEPIADLTPEAIEAFNTSDEVMKLRSGKPKAAPSYLKTRRVLRLALAWAVETGLLDTTPCTDGRARKAADAAPADEKPKAKRTPRKSRKGRVVVHEAAPLDEPLPEDELEREPEYDPAQDAFELRESQETAEVATY